MEMISNNQKGFTLVELLIALVVFAVGILGLATMQLTSIQGNSKGRMISEGSNIAIDRIERFMALPYDHAFLADDGGQLPAVVDGAAGLASATAATADGTATNGNYQIFWNVADDYPIANTKTIRVIIAPPGNERNISMDVVITRPI